jgi:protein-tyrosine phosphatase
LETTVFEKHERLGVFPPAKLAYIVYRRVVEHGSRTTWLWIKDKFVRRTQGFSVPSISRVAPHLYVGGQHSQRGLSAMRGLGITSVVNMREESDDAARGVALDHLLWLPTTDDAAPSVQDLVRGSAFIEKHVSAGDGVYIHCASGVGRAPTMAAAYFVRHGSTAEQAWEIIRKGRPFIRPTPPQIAVIRALAEQQSRPGSTGGDAVAPLTAPTGDSPEPEGSRGKLLEGLNPSLDQREALAYERIAGDPGLTGDLTDDDATILLDWARTEVHRLVGATTNVDESGAWEILDPKLSHLRHHLRLCAELSSAAEHPGETLRKSLAAFAYPETQL